MFRGSITTDRLTAMRTFKGTLSPNAGGDLVFNIELPTTGVYRLRPACRLTGGPHTGKTIPIGSAHYIAGIADALANVVDPIPEVDMTVSREGGGVSLIEAVPLATLPYWEGALVAATDNARLTVRFTTIVPAPVTADVILVVTPVIVPESPQ